MANRTTSSKTGDWQCPRCEQRFLTQNQVHSCNRQTIDAFLGDDPMSKRLFEALYRFLATIGPFDDVATKTQITFRTRTGFAYLWFANRVRGTPNPEPVLTIALRRRLTSPRIREAVNPRSDLWVHHIPFNAEADLDDEIKAWLREAYQTATTTTPRRKRGQ